MKTPLIAVTALLLLQMATPAQQLQTSKASLSGVVTRAGTGEPLGGARVSIASGAAAATAPALPAGVVMTSAGGGGTAEATLVASAAATPAGAAAATAIASVTTGADGRFVFENLDPGLYRLQVLRNGFARQSYGQRTPTAPASAIRLAPGQSVENIVVALVPAGNVSGVIRDADGQPQTGAPVQLLRATFNSSGQRTFQLSGSARTNDRGEYRLYWITPGRYYISAGAASGPSRPIDPNTAAASPNEVPGQSYALRYYPGVADARAAGVIEVSPGTELNGIDFTVPPQRLYRVRGLVVDSATGQPPAAAGISLAYRTLTGVSGAFSSGSRYDAATGAFELRNVPPGAYVLQAIATDAAPEGETVLRIGAIATKPNARVPIEVSDADIDGVALRLSAGVSLPGRLTIDGMALSSVPGWERIRVQLKPALDSAFGPNLQPAAPVGQAPGPDGTFTIAGVSPGEFILGPIAGLPAGLYVKEARFNERDALGEPLRFSGAGGPGLEILLSARVSQLDGTALNTTSRPAAGAHVVLVPDRRERADLYKTALSDANGRFLFRNVPPGDYRVFAWEALDSYAYFDGDLLRRVERQGSAVRISESVGSSVTVGMIPADQ